MKKETEMNYVTVIHSAFGDDNIKVAKINVGSRNENAALNYAYFRTQNIDGSWSRESTIFADGKEIENFDYSADTEVLAELPEINGKVFGHRSTSVDDKLLFNNKTFVVDFCGFKQV